MNTEPTPIEEASKDELIELFEQEMEKSEELLADLNRELRRCNDVKQALASLISAIKDLDAEKPNLNELKYLKHLANEYKAKTEYTENESRLLIFDAMQDWKKQVPNEPYFSDLEN